jgi:hypothetical protein
LDKRFLKLGEDEMRVIIEMFNGDEYTYNGVTNLDDKTELKRIKGYKNKNLVFNLNRSDIKNLHTEEE